MLTELERGIEREWWLEALPQGVRNVLRFNEVELYVILHINS